MSGLKQLIQQIHRRSLWQILAIYLAGAWFGYEIIEALTERAGLPEWFPDLAIVLFIVGLPIVLATAFVQEGGLAGRRSDPTLLPGADTELGDVALTSESLRPAGAGRFLTWRNAIAGGVLAFALWGVVAAGWLLLADGSIGEEGEIGRKMIVVLPFENLGAPEDEYFADGITEEITSRVAELRELGVIARTSAIQYKNTEKSIPDIGEELDVEYILEGTVRWEKRPQGESRVRVTPQLIRVSDATHLWTERYDAVLAGVFQIQSDIAEQVASALNITLLDAERSALQSQPTANLEAYDFYLRGNDYSNRSFDSDDYQIAIQMYENAVQLDPEFAIAYANLSLTHSRMYWYRYDRTQERLNLAKSTVDRAFRLQPDLPEAHLALGYFYYYGHRDYERALEQFAVVQDRRPNASEVHQAAGYILRRQGQWKEAAANLRLAAEFDPRDALLANQLGITYLRMRRYTESEHFLSRSIALLPDWPHTYRAKAMLHLLWAGDRDRARKVLRDASGKIEPSELTAHLVDSGAGHTGGTLLRIFHDDFEGSLLALTSSSSGEEPAGYHLSKAGMYDRMGRSAVARAQYDSARVILEGAIEIRPTDDLPRALLGLALAGLGEDERAISEAERAADLLPLSADAYDGADRLAQLAEVYMRVGAYDRALDVLETTLSVPGYMSTEILLVDPLWGPLHDHPRFKEIVSQD